MILRKINPDMNEKEYIDNVPNANQAFITHLVQNQNGNTSTFALKCPVEIHPYIRETKLQNFEKYIIGTFPPISYVLDNENIRDAGIDCVYTPNNSRESRPAVDYFHGNKGSMWDLLVGDNLFDFNANNDILRFEKKEAILAYLKDKRINYSDIIYSLKRKGYNAEDTSLKNIIIYDRLIEHISDNPHLNRILFNTSPTFSTEGFKTHANNVGGGVQGRINVNSKCSSFALFFRRCQDLGIRVEFKVETHNEALNLEWTEVNLANTAILNKWLKTKILFKAKISVPPGILNNEVEIIKEFFVITPFSPAARSKVEQNPIVNTWMNNNPGLNRNVFLTQIYQRFVRFNQEDKIFLMTLNHF